MKLSRMLCAFGLLSLIMLGCDKPTPRGNVSGKVYVGDKLANGGEVRFHNADNSVIVAMINKDGTYGSMIPIGDYKISVHPPLDMMTGISGPPKGVEPIVIEKKGDNVEEKKEPKGPVKEVPIPAKYALPDASGFTISIKQGENPYDVKMAPGPAAPKVKAAIPPNMKR